ncbi:MAG: TIGR02221 family CRISPR-associated protein [Anaerolineae bacterium]|nr:MAG: TIGR02221 family CRISPR-associated protein [Anaerolineae bacterium]
MTENLKVISFLGVSKYSPTRYIWKGQEIETKFFPEAVAHFIKPSKMMICLTPTAREHENWQELRQRLEGAHVLYEPLPIPEGHTESDLWTIFKALTDAVDENENLVFDITHSFRSLPFLSFLAIAYLKAAKNVKVQNVLYGAWEARNSCENCSPVFDLTPFVSLLDWLAATEQFVQTGNARSLSILMNPHKEKNGALSKAASTLEIISQAARLCQPFTLMQEVSQLEATLNDAQSIIEVDIPPFNVLKQKIVDTFRQFECETSEINEETLKKEYQLIEWYYQKGQFMQAVSLAREWLIDATTFRLGESIKLAMNDRKPFEEAISGVALVDKSHPQDSQRKFTVNDLNRHGLTIWEWNEAERELLRQLWTDLKNVRNTLDHAEHLPKEKKEKTLTALRKLQSKMDEKVMNGLRQVATKWNLVE